MSQKLIVAVDDEPDLLELIRFNLEREGYRFLGAETGEAGLALVNGLVASDDQDGRPALIILDLMLPGIDGLSLCRKLKAAPDTRDIPVIMLTAKGEETDVVTGLEVGADDYISKPFSPRVLIARVRSLLRSRDDMKEQLADALQKNPAGGAVPAAGIGTIAGSPARSGADRGPTGSTAGSQNIVVGQIQIDLPRHEVRCAGSPVDLSATEFAILEFLARNPGWVFSRNRIIDGVKGKDYPVTERSVDVQILGLRKKLGSLGDYIQTVRGVGYRLQVP